MIKLDGPLILAGAGKMGGALLDGMLANGLDPHQVIIQDPHIPDAQADAYRARGICVAAELDALENAPSVLLVAVKPQVMDAVFPALAKLAGADTLIISVAAGKSIASYQAHLTEPSPIIRAMPNTPAAIGQGMTVCVGSDGVTDAQRALTTHLMETVGAVAWIDDEAQMDAVTAISGSGPAYVFHLAECMARAGVALGLDEKTAAELAAATVSGAGALIKASDESPAKLRENVTSPAGTTAAGLSVLMDQEAGLGQLIEATTAAAASRSRDLSKG